MTTCMDFFRFSGGFRSAFGLANARVCQAKVGAFGMAWMAFLVVVAAAADVDPQLIAKGLARLPKQADASFDEVASADVASCKGAYETRNGVRGLLISAANGNALRWLADTNGDEKIDQFCYFKDGVESYRDMDTDHDGKTDQSRWLGMAGMRWGVDRDQDGKIDEWKMISAEEVTLEAVEAIRTNDGERFDSLLLTDEETTSLGLGSEKRTALSQRLTETSAEFRKLSAGQKTIDSSARWASFGADKPGVVPAGTDGSTKDIVAYENAMAAVETKEGTQQIVVGTLVRVGDKWRLIDVPKIASEGTVVNEGGLFFASTASNRMVNGNGGQGVLPAEVERLHRDLEAIEKELMAATGDERARWHDRKADLMVKLIANSSTREDVQAWVEQMADQVQSAVQAGEYPEGLDRLKRLESDIKLNPEAQREVPYVAYRVLNTQYTVAMNAKNPNFELIQREHIENLKAFVEKYPESLDSADAMINLGLNSELTNDLKEAEGWYEKVANAFGQTPEGEKARGAIQRLNLKGQTIAFTGKTLQGKDFSTAKLNKPVIIHYWASWCVPCKADMLELKKLQTKYAKSGLVIVGINADNSSKDAIDYLQQNKNIDWVHLHEDRGLNSRMAVGLGVFSLPVTIVIDKTGKVVEASSHYTPNMEDLIQGLLK
jgi:thiol-disulfide isomerase/thioredoxin